MNLIIAPDDGDRADTWNVFFCHHSTTWCGC